MGHKEVKAALATRLADVPDWLAEDADEPTVLIADVLPADEKLWPCILIQTTRASGGDATGVVGQLRWTYDCEITVGVRSTTGDRGTASIDATQARDVLLAAVRHALIYAPTLTTGMQVLVGQRLISEDTAPTPEDAKGRAMTLGSIRFQVRADETTPAPSTADDEPTVETATTTVDAFDADTDPLA